MRGGGGKSSASVYQDSSKTSGTARFPQRSPADTGCSWLGQAGLTKPTLTGQ